MHELFKVEVERLREGLKRLDWSDRICPVCQGIDPACADKYLLKVEDCGHKPDCWFGNMIGGGE